VPSRASVRAPPKIAVLEPQLYHTPGRTQEHSFVRYPPIIGVLRGNLCRSYAPHQLRSGEYSRRSCPKQAHCGRQKRLVHRLFHGARPPRPCGGMASFRPQVSGPGRRGQASGARFQGPGFRGQVSGARFQGPGFRGQVSGARFQGPGFRGQASGPRAQAS
jgi:hypothetical protein